MTKEQLDAIRARVEAATPGPWEAWTAVCCPDCGWVDGPQRTVCPVYEGTKPTHTLDANDAEFIAHAREDVPALLAEVERLRNAHAMSVQVSGELCEKCGWAMKFPDEKCRCELLAEVEAKVTQNVALIGQNGRLQQEVERLNADPLPAAAWVREVERAAFKRGVAAMRKEAADLAWLMHGQRNLAQHIRALPDPEDK